MDEGEVATPPRPRWPCVILLPNGAGHQREAKVFPLVKAPTFDRLLAESSNRFAREITRIFVVLPDHHPDGGSAPATELNSANYVDVCTCLPPRCVLYVSCGEPFNFQNPSCGQAVVAPPPPPTEHSVAQTRAHEVAQEMAVTIEVAVAGGDELGQVTEKHKEEEEEEGKEKEERKVDDQSEEEPRETHHLLVMAKRNERSSAAVSKAKKTRPNSRDLELQRQQKRASRDFREDEFLSQLRRVRLSAPQVKTVNWSNMAMSTMPDWHQNWTAIEEVQMHHNNFTSFPMKIVDEPNFRHIKILNLSYNRIPRLPDEFLLLQGLTSLNLTCNKLTSCYPALLLPSLTELDLSENCLSVITRRDILHPNHGNDVDDDDGESSPQVAAHALTSLSLNLNLLESLPVEMEHLSSLRYLYVKDNPFKPPLHKLNNAGNQAIMLHFLADLLSESPGSPSANRNRTLSGSFSAREAIEAGGLAIIPIEELALDVSASPLGRGAHGVVWRGTYQGQTVAVKNVSSIAKFCQEVGILSSLKLKYCIKYHGVCVVSGITLVVMEYAPMADLGKVLKDLRHNLTLEEKVRIALKVAKGMEELHRAGILHCDLKCKNILVFETNPWKIKLNDFGLSTQYKVALCAKAPSSDATMYFPCTAPEVLENQPFSMKSDVYSYAMFLYELFTGRKPFKGLTIDEIVRLVTKGSRPPLAHLDKSSQRPSTPAVAASSDLPPPAPSLASSSSSPTPPASLPVEETTKPSPEQLHLTFPAPSPVSPASSAPQSTSPRSRSPGPLSSSSSSSTTGRVLQPAEVKEMLLRAHKVARRKKDFVSKHELEGLLTILADFTHQRSSSSSTTSASLSASSSSSSISPITESVLEKMMERAQAFIHLHSDSHFPLSPNYAAAEEEPEEGGQTVEQSPDEIAESEARQHTLRKIRRIIEKCWSGRPHQRPSFSEIVSKVSQIYWKGSKGTRSRTGWISGNERLTFSLLCKKANVSATLQALARSNNTSTTTTSNNKDQP